MTSATSNVVTMAPPRAAPVELDLARLLQPIPGPSPTGMSLRYESEYDRIREARRDEDPNLPQGVWQHDLKRADWSLVIELCVDALSERSKDLQIACWLLDALVHRRGFAGLAEGLGILVALCDEFWPDLFPAIEEGDLAARLAPIEWIDDKLPEVIYTLPLTCCGTPEPVSYSWTDFVNAQRRDIARSSNSGAGRGAEATLEAFNASAEATPTSFYQELEEQLDLGLAAIESAAASLDRHCGKAAPGLVHLREALGNVQGFVGAVLAQRSDAIKPAAPVSARLPEAEEAAPPAAAQDSFLAAGSSSAPRIQIHSREEAYRLLMEIADYLFAVEPHSPTPYIVQRAASWGMMPLHKLLVELTKGSNDLATLFELLGIGPDGEATKGRGVG
jgi:type VI secretion system protein ImpA